MIGGLPLTFFRETISGKLMMIIGLFVVFTGPFIFLYPDRIREFFAATEHELDEADSDIMMYVDAFVRVSAGAILIYVSISSGLLHK